MIVEVAVLIGFLGGLTLSAFFLLQRCRKSGANSIGTALLILSLMISSGGAALAGLTAYLTHYVTITMGL
jgi:hypothetical protein